MNRLADRIVDVIADYRGGHIDRPHVLRWAKQFHSKDREFLLSELAFVLTKSYVSKSRARKSIRNFIKLAAEDEGCKSVRSLLAHSKFVACQAKQKSQSEILGLVDEHLMRVYGLTVDSCGHKGVKFLLYLDDVLATGGTFVKDISKLLQKGSNFRAAKVIRYFFFVHTWGESNSEYQIKLSLGDSVVQRMELYRLHSIENDPRINRYNSNPTFNHCYPASNSRNVKIWNEYLDSLEKASRNREFAFRDPTKPSQEMFFSSSTNRMRYESILLNMGIRILQDTNTISPPVRPLGFTIPSNQTFGTGGHAFTWRNVSNTCPLVFWWEVNGWYPLFPVQNRGLKSSE